MRRIAVTLFTLALCACGADTTFAPRGTGRGTLITAAVMHAAAGQVAVVPFDVQLPCGPGGPMRDLTATAGQLVDPNDAVMQFTPPPHWQTADRVTYDCTENEWQRVSHLEVAFTPTAVGTYRVDLTLEPGVGTFSRAVEAQ